MHSVNKRAKEPFTCPHDGYFPDPDNCSKYYLCSGASLTQHDCGEGLTWDAELQLCGWANTIDCRNGNRPWEKITDMNGSNNKILSLIMASSLSLNSFVLTISYPFSNQKPKACEKKENNICT